jgi:hypothetical protein
VDRPAPAWTASTWQERCARCTSVARLLREEGESLPLVQPETVATASLQLWSRLRDDLVLDMTRLRNRLHALLLLCDPEYKSVIRSLRSRIGIHAARAYTASGTKNCLKTGTHVGFPGRLAGV